PVAPSASTTARVAAPRSASSLPTTLLLLIVTTRPEARTPWPSRRSIQTPDESRLAAGTAACRRLAPALLSSLFQILPEPRACLPSPPRPDPSESGRSRPG